MRCSACRTEGNPSVPSKHQIHVPVSGAQGRAPGLLVDTGGVANTEREWIDAVQAAAVAGDSSALTALFAQGHALFGEQAGEMWARALSGLDGTAVTG